MENPFAEARYLPIPELSPYIRHDRFERPKEVAKHIARTLDRVTERDRSYEYADIACANGELLYFLRQQFPSWSFTGYDLTPEFIAAGRSYPGMAGIELHVADLYDVDAQFDIVSFINIMTALWDPEEPILKLLSLVRPGGILLIDGCFNPFDVEFRAVFMDNSRPESAGQWRRDFSQHSRSRLASILDGRCRSFEFEDIEMGIDLPRDPEAPHSNVWTFRDAGGRAILTNGTHMMMEKSLLVIHV